MESDFPEGIGNPARRALENAGYTHLEQLVRVREADLAKLHGMGPKALGLLHAALAERGLAFEGKRVERAELEAFLKRFQGAEASYPFGPEACVYKVRGKMFALVSQEGAPSVTLKCTPEDGELLVSRFEAVRPGYHMNKRHWLTVVLGGDLPDTMLRGLAEDSYALVVKGLSKAVRAGLETP